MYALIGALVSLAIRLMNRSPEKLIESTDGEAITLRLNRFYQISGIITIGIGGLFSFFILTDETETNPLIVLIFVWIFCLMLALPVLLWYMNHRVTFDEETVTSWDWRGRKTSIAWQEITEVKFNALAGSIMIKGNGEVAKAHQHLVGLKSLLQMLVKKTPWRAKELNLPIK